MSSSKDTSNTNTKNNFGVVNGKHSNREAGAYNQPENTDKSSAFVFPTIEPK